MSWLVSCLVSWFDVLLVVWLASWLVVSNWILMSCQQHRVTSGEERERGLVISKLYFGVLSSMAILERDSHCITSHVPQYVTVHKF